MQLWVRRTEELMLVPATRLDVKLIEKLPLLKRVFCDIKRPRNAKHHRKFFALMSWAFQHQGMSNNFDWFRAFVTCKAGYCSTCELPPEKVDNTLLTFLREHESHVFFEPTKAGLIRIMIPRSIAWDKMDQEEFDVFYPRALDVLMTEFGIDPEHFEEQPR